MSARWCQGKSCQSHHHWGELWPTTNQSSTHPYINKLCPSNQPRCTGSHDIRADWGRHPWSSTECPYKYIQREDFCSPIVSLCEQGRMVKGCEIMTVFAGSISPAYSDRCTKVNQILQNLTCTSIATEGRERFVLTPWPKVQCTWSLFMFTGGAPCIIQNGETSLVWPLT